MIRTRHPVIFLGFYSDVIFKYAIWAKQAPRTSNRDGDQVNFAHALHLQRVSACPAAAPTLNTGIHRLHPRRTCIDDNSSKHTQREAQSCSRSCKPRGTVKRFQNFNVTLLDIRVRILMHRLEINAHLTVRL